MTLGRVARRSAPRATWRAQRWRRALHQSRRKRKREVDEEDEENEEDGGEADESEEDEVHTDP